MSDSPAPTRNAANADPDATNRVHPGEVNTAPADNTPGAHRRPDTERAIQPPRGAHTWPQTATRRTPDPDIETRLRAATVGGLQPLTQPLVIAAYDPAWPELFAREADRIRGALGDTIVQLEHAGSTSVPGLAAKPLIDILLVVEDAADEARYVPALEAAGYTLRIREPDWFEHRLFKGTDPGVNLHVFSRGCREIGRMLCFRDHLRANPADRQRYEDVKRALAAREWTYTQEYADAKNAVVDDIMTRADPEGRFPRFS